MPTLKISPQSYDEFKSALEKVGRQPNDKGQLVLEKDDTLVPPFDVRTQAIRKDCLVHAIDVCKDTGNIGTDEILDIANKFYNYIFEGTI
jgi:hypothetical protein